MGCCYSSYTTLPESENLKSTDEFKVHVNEKGDVVFEPLKNVKRTGVIVYPGATAAPKGYAYFGHHLAKNGYFTVLVKMPCNTAAYAPNRASDIVERYQQVEKWVLGGHSLGGLMSTQFFYEKSRSNKLNTVKFVGLFHLGTRGYAKHDISKLKLPTLVVYSGLDGLIKRELVEECFKYLPQDTLTVKLLEGGNHSYFGDFPVGRFLCLRDNEATITKEEQLQLTLHEMLQFLNRFL